MEAAAQPSAFIASLEQMSRLKELLLQQHEGEVALLRGECSRLQKESSVLRGELEKANAQLIDPSPQHGNGNGSLSGGLAGRLARRVLSEPIPPSPPPVVHQAPEVPDTADISSATEAHAMQVFAKACVSPRSTSPAVSLSLPAGSVKDDLEETPSRRNSVEAKLSKDSYPRSPSSRRRSMSPRSERRKGTARSGPGYNRHDSGGNKSAEAARAEGRGRATLPSLSGRSGSAEDFNGVVPGDQHLREASPRRKRGMHRAATMGSLPGMLPSQMTERRVSTGGQSVDSMEFLGAGSIGLGSRCSSRGGSSIACKLDDGDRFNLRDIWRENSNLLHTSLKNWRGAPDPALLDSKPSTFREKMSLTFLATGSLRPAGSLRPTGSQRPGSVKPLTALHPASRLRLIWELVSLMLVIYDIAVVPMRCFDWPPESTADATDWISRVFWTTDILASFMTGVYINFELETRFSVVAKHYAKTWMAFDVTIVVSEWIPLIIPPSSDQSGATRNIFDIVRLLRFARILRLLKLEMAFENFGTIISSKTAWKLNGVVRIFLYFVVGAHMAACGWYWVGTDTTNGWVARESMGGQPVDYQYLTSMHWTLTQLHGASEVGPGNATEALYAIIALLLGVCSLCVLLSSATSEMVQLEETRSSASKQHLLMLSYLRKNHVGRELSLAVKKCFDLHMNTRLQENKDIEVKEAVAFLPLNLQMDLAEEIRRPVVVNYGFFLDIDAENPRIIRQLCHDCCSEQAVRPTESVFAAGDACACMYFVVKGEFQYTRSWRASTHPRPSGREGEAQALELEELDKSSEDTDVEKDSQQQGDNPPEEWSLDRGNWISEAVLWTTWEHCGELKAGLFATLLRLDAMKFARMLSQHHANACAYAVRYGRMFVKQLNDCPESAWSDVLENIKITKDDVLEEDQAQEDDADRLDGSKGLGSGQFERRLSKCRTMNQHTQHYIFISHHKAAAGTEATLMQEALERMIDQDPEEPGNQMHAPVFLDSEDLSDLNDLKAHVRNTINLVLLLTEEVLKRPWCLIEIVTAFKCNIHILPVEIQKRDNKSPFVYPDEEFYKKLREGSLLSKAETDLIQDEGIAVEDLEKALRHVFKKIAVPFSPHKSGLVREAELKDILRRCMDTIHRSESSVGNFMSDFPGMPPGVGLPMVGVSSVTSVRSGMPVNFQDSNNDTPKQAAMTPMVTDSSDGSCSGAQNHMPVRSHSDAIDEDGPDADAKSATSLS